MGLLVTLAGLLSAIKLCRMRLKNKGFTLYSLPKILTTFLKEFLDWKFNRKVKMKLEISLVLFSLQVKIFFQGTRLIFWLFFLLCGILVLDLSITWMKLKILSRTKKQAIWRVKLSSFFRISKIHLLSVVLQPCN